jgi:hypothetical protein
MGAGLRLPRLHECPSRNNCGLNLMFRDRVSHSEGYKQATLDIRLVPADCVWRAEKSFELARHRKIDIVKDKIGQGCMSAVDPNWA